MFSEVKQSLSFQIMDAVFLLVTFYLLIYKGICHRANHYIIVMREGLVRAILYNELGPLRTEALKNP